MANYCTLLNNENIISKRPLRYINNYHSVELTLQRKAGKVVGLNCDCIVLQSYRTTFIQYTCLPLLMVQLRTAHVHPDLPDMAGNSNVFIESKIEFLIFWTSCLQILYRKASTVMLLLPSVRKFGL